LPRGRLSGRVAFQAAGLPASHQASPAFTAARAALL